MANYYFEGDGLYPLNFEPNTETTTFVISGIPQGATVVVGRSTANGWTPLPNSTLQNHLPVAISHGHDVNLSVLVNGSTGATMELDTQKQGVPDYYSILNQITENTAPNDQDYVLRTEYDADQAALDDRLTVLESSGDSEFETFQMTWKPSSPYPVYQIPTPDGTPNTVTYTDITQTSLHVSGDTGTGVITILEDVLTMQISIAAQVVRTSGGGIAEWGIFFESFDGSNWVEIPDSTRFISINNNTDNEYRNVTYTVFAGALPAGSQVRLRHIANDSSDNIGLITDQPFANAPVAAGIVVSMATYRRT